MEILDHPTKAQQKACWRIYSAALRRGELVPATTCAWCETPKGRIHGHHPDYSRPLMVVWLCAKCHRKHHAEDMREWRIFRADRGEPITSAALRRAGVNIPGAASA